MILERIALFRLVEDDSVFHGYLHFRFVCGILLAFVYKYIPANYFVLSSFSPFWPLLNRFETYFFAGLGKHCFALTAAHTGVLI